MMDRRDVQAFLKGVSTVVREQLSSMAASLSRLEARIEAVAAVQPLKGEPGESVKGDAGASAYELARSAGFTGSLEEWLMSLRGKDAAPVDVDSLVIRAAELVPQPKVPEIDFAAVVAQVRAAIELPAPVDEESIILRTLDRMPKPVEPIPSLWKEDLPQMVAAEVTRAVAALPPPQAGKDADMEALYDRIDKAAVRYFDDHIKTMRGLLSEELSEHVAALPKPEKGEPGASIHPDTVALMIREAVDKLPKPEPGKPGEPGKSALEIEVRTGIDPEKSYPVGTVATYQGGTIRAFRNTDAVTDGLQNAGWQVLLDGVADEHFIQGEDFRSLTFTRTYTSGRVVSVEMKTPFMQHIGYWDKSKEYFRSECVTHNGSTWYCMVDSTTEKPGEGSTHWLLIARKGSDGKDYREPAPKNGSVHFK